MKLGMSLYFNTPLEENIRNIKKAAEAGIRYAFTSLQIPEESGINYSEIIGKILSACKEADIHLFIDVSPDTLEKLNCENITELASLGVSHVRLDYGYSAKETVELSKVFHIVFNASTVTDTEIYEWRREGADFSRFTACHNFYPKPLTGLSMERVKKINRRLKLLGFQTMAFVPGDTRLRGPLEEGLPTVEEHRNRKEEVLLNVLQLHYDGECDVILTGDPYLTDRAWNDLKNLSEGYICLNSEINEKYSYIRDIVHHEREDSSEYVIRSIESRQQFVGEVVPEDVKERKKGSISVSNSKYLRYMGELEIARKALPSEPRVNVVGYVAESDLKYLPYIRNSLGFRFT